LSRQGSTRNERKEEAMRPSVNGDGIGGRWGVGVAAITTLIAMAFGLVASSYSERGAHSIR
jgi:hypothetical protein